VRILATKNNSIFRFDRSRIPIASAEAEIFQMDLQGLGLDETVWQILNSSVMTSTADSMPQVLRAYDDRNRLIGVAFFVECRRVNKYLLPQRWLGNMLDSIPVPMFFWVRYTSLVDAISNPGFVAAGIDRSEFTTAAIDYLKSVYLYGGIIDRHDVISTASPVNFPFCDAGIVDLRGINNIESWLEQHKNLKRKINKFKNKNGCILTLRGAMPTEVSTVALRLLNGVEGLVAAPFQDNYPNMAIAACELPTEKLLHIVAKLDDRMVGYQSFAISGQTLWCLSGIFDRDLHTTYHAYENIILASIEFAISHNLEQIEYGPILNPTKLKMMNSYRACTQHYYYRWGWMAGIFKQLIPLTKLAPQTFVPYIRPPARILGDRVGSG
jgi:hypothetical protein